MARFALIHPTKAQEWEKDSQIKFWEVTVPLKLSSFAVLLPSYGKSCKDP